MAEVGRPTKMTEATIKKLEDAFALGCTDREACLAADISTTTLYNFCEVHPAFLERKERLKANPYLKARKVVLDAVEGGDVLTAKWLVEKADGKARQAVEMSGPDGGALTVQVVSFKE